jgi:uncharacterized protein
MIKTVPIKHDIVSLIPNAKEYLRSNKDVLFAYLFGSFAKNCPKPLSDIDIAVYLDCNDHAQARFNIIGELISIFKTDEIDLVVLNSAPLGLKMRILKPRYILADNAPFNRHIYESITMRSYFDFVEIETGILEKRFFNG